MSQTDDQLIAQFLAEELSAADKQAFLERLEAEPELREQLKLERELMASLNEEDWAFAKNTDHEEVKEYTAAFSLESTEALKESIRDASEAYHKNNKTTSKPKTRRLWVYGIAATLALVLTFTFLPAKNQAPELLYAQYLAKTELPDVTTRSADDGAAALMRAQGYLNNEEYEKAATAFELLLVQMPERSELYINLAYCQSPLNQYDEAIGTLNQLINSNLLDAPKGYWHQSLVYLKALKTGESKSLLQTIIDNNYYNQELARKLLDEL